MANLESSSIKLFHGCVKLELTQLPIKRYARRSQRRGAIFARRVANFRRTADGRSLISSSDDYGGRHRRRRSHSRRGRIKHNAPLRGSGERAKIMPARAEKEPT